MKYSIYSPETGQILGRGETTDMALVHVGSNECCIEDWHPRDSIVDCSCDPVEVVPGPPAPPFGSLRIDPPNDQLSLSLSQATTEAEVQDWLDSNLTATNHELVIRALAHLVMHYRRGGV